MAVFIGGCISGCIGGCGCDYDYVSIYLLSCL